MLIAAKFEDTQFHYSLKALRYKGKHQNICMCTRFVPLFVIERAYIFASL